MNNTWQRTSMVYKNSRSLWNTLGTTEKRCEVSLFYLQFSSTNIIMQLENDPVSCGKKSCSEHQTLFLAAWEGLHGQETNCCQRRRKEESGLVGGERKKGDRKTEWGNNKAERKEKDGRRWYTSHIAVTMDQPTCNLVFQIILPSHCTLCPLWKSSSVAEGETVVAASWTLRLQRVEQLWGETFVWKETKMRKVEL